VAVSLAVIERQRVKGREAQVSRDGKTGGAVEATAEEDDGGPADAVALHGGGLYRSMRSID